MYLCYIYIFHFSNIYMYWCVCICDDEDDDVGMVISIFILHENVSKGVTHSKVGSHH